MNNILYQWWRFICIFFVKLYQNLPNTTPYLYGFLLCWGVIMSFSLSYSMGFKMGHHDFMFFFKYCSFAFISIVLCISVFFYPWRHFVKTALVGYIVVLVLVLLVLLIGHEVKGATRWIYISSFSLQPSALLKVFAVIKNAYFLSRLQYYGRKFFILFLFTTGLELILLFLEPDFGSILVVLFCFGVQIFCSHIKKYTLFIASGIALIVIFISVISLDHVRNRVIHFFDAKYSVSYQVSKSVKAIQRGGILGTGMGTSKLKYQLPEAHNDFIFSIISEEMGMISSIVVCLIYFLIAITTIIQAYRRILYNSTQNGMFCFQIIIGGISIIICEAIIHIGVNTNLIPPTGIVLPIISYGGSSLVSYAILIGILLKITTKNNKYWV